MRLCAARGPLGAATALARTPSFVLASLLFLVQMLAHFAVLARGAEYLATRLTIDDTYYYLQTAWNHATLGFPTFDGVSRTNGFQFLWYLILWCAARFVPTKQSLLPVALGISAVFVALPYFFFHAVGKRYHSFALAASLSFVWFATYVAPWGTLTGMENSLHLFVSVWVLFEVLTFFHRLREGSRASVWRLTLALVANGYCRVDSGVYSAVLFCVCVLALVLNEGNLSSAWRVHGKSVCLCILLAMGAAAIQLGVYHYWNGTVIPISGLVKFASGGLDSTLITRVEDVFRGGLPYLPGRGPLLVFCSIYLLLILGSTCISLWLIKTRSSTGWAAACRAYLALLFASTAYCAALLASPVSDFPLWYFSPVTVFWIYSLGLSVSLVGSFGGTQMQRASKRRTCVRAALVVFSLGCVGCPRFDGHL